MPRDKYGLPGIYNASPLTLPDGGGSALAVDSSGRLLVSPTSGGSDVNIADIGGTAVVTAGVNGLLAIGGNAASGATDSGNPVKVAGVYNSSAPTFTNGQRGDIQLDSRGNLKIGLPTSSTATPSNVNGSASSVTILASNTNRKNASVFNDSSAVLYLLWGSGTASVTNYTVQIASGQYYELPNQPIFTAQLTGIWSSATGTARVTEAV